MFAQNSLERRLLAYLKPHWKIILAGTVCSLGLSAASTGGLAAAAYYGLNALAEGHRGTLEKICWGIVGLYILRWALSMGQSIFFAEASQRISQSLRIDVYKHLQSLSLSYFDSRRTGNLLSTFSNDVPVVQNGIMSIKDMIASPVMIVAGFVGIFVISWRLSLITIVLMPFMGIAINAVTKKLRSISLESQNRLADIITITEETLSGARLVRAFSAEQREIRRFADSIQAAKDISMTGIRRSALLSPTTDLLGAVGIAVTLWIGGTEILHHTLTVGGLGAFVALVDKIRVGVGGLGGIGITWKQTMGASDRVFGGVLDVPSEVTNAPNAKSLELISGEVDFDAIGFGYRKDQTVLRNITFKMKPGQVTAIVGPSGAGKSTLADLIPRFYDVKTGTISVDGQDIKKVTIESLREHIGIVPQETIIFGGTVRENIMYGKPDATPDEIIAAARHANAHDFIQSLPKRYDTIVGERGVTLSGGQRQRIAIARALLKNPRILILDEATSSLDETSQILVQEALETLMQGRTTLVIAHRLSTIKNADLIVVMDEGRIVESGSHEKLMAFGGVYSRLYETQFRSVTAE